ncbi:hypothetical protein ACLOJK_026455 [Asimina triloba]
MDFAKGYVKALERRVEDKSLNYEFFRWVEGGSISNSGDEVCSWAEPYSGIEKIEELELDFGDLVGYFVDLKDFQVAETSRIKLTSRAKLRQLKEKIYRLEEAEYKREFKLNHPNKN